MEGLEQELEKIKERNKKVETDKAWELSWTRRLFISALTYITALVWLMMIKEHYAAWKAFVPVAGYVLSTLSLPFIKNTWARHR